MTNCAQILLVEDDPKLVEVLTAAVSQDGFSLVHVGDGPAALEAMRQRAFDLVLLDLGLPGMDGFAVLQELRRELAWKQIPILVVTAAHTMRDKVRSFELGANDFVTKPFDLAELRARVRASLRAKRLQDELEIANRAFQAGRIAAEENARARTEFLANMSHEIRTPMNGVIAMTGLLLQSELTAEQRDCVETIRSSGDALMRIVNDILHFAKIESGKLELEQRPFYIRACVEGVLDMLAAKAAEKNLELIYRMDPAAPEMVLGDTTRLQQVFTNLVGNAIKFTEAGEVFISVEAQPCGPGGITADDNDPRLPVASGGHPWWEIHFSITDTGIGIPSDRVCRLFQSYVQVNSSISRQYGGTGLGLAISKGLVELMGGKIWVESVVGQGSTFHVVLPFQSVAEDHPSSVCRIHPKLSGRRLLLIETNATSRQMLQELAGVWGMQARTASSTEQALARMSQSEPFDLVLLDARLAIPGDANPLLAALRESPATRRAAVLLMTSPGARAANSGPASPAIQAIVVKPIKPGQLQAVLQQALAGPVSTPVSTGPQNRKLDPALADRLPLRVLLADDNLINQKVASRLLQQMGYRAEVVRSGMEVLRALEQKPYDLILMDVQMPELDGLETTRRIRQRQRESPAVPPFQSPIGIIAMTAGAMQGDREKCLAAGMDDYLSKPVRPEALQAAIERCGARLVQSATSLVPAPEPGAPASPAAAPEATAEPPVDLSRLLEFACHDREQLGEMIQLYVQQTDHQLKELEAALAAGNLGEATRIAHSCAGASGTCGVEPLMRLLRQFEALAKEGKQAELPPLLPQFHREFARVQQFLETQTKEPLPA